MKSVNEVIVDGGLNAKTLHKKFVVEHGIYIDSRSEDILNNLRVAYKMRKEGVKEKDVLKAMKSRPIRVGSHLYCEEYGLGRVTDMYDSGNAMVLFEKKELPIMCDTKKMVTIHDDKARKLKLIY